MSSEWVTFCMMTRAIFTQSVWVPDSLWVKALLLRDLQWVLSFTVFTACFTVSCIVLCEAVNRGPAEMEPVSFLHTWGRLLNLNWWISEFERPLESLWLQVLVTDTVKIEKRLDSSYLFMQTCIPFITVICCICRVTSVNKYGFHIQTLTVS